eukprot:s147_g12.t1
MINGWKFLRTEVLRMHAAICEIHLLSFFFKEDGWVGCWLVPVAAVHHGLKLRALSTPYAKGADAPKSSDVTGGAGKFRFVHVELDVTWQSVNGIDLVAPNSHW